MNPSKTNPRPPALPPAAHRRGGFTLVELMSATFVGLMLIAMFVAAFTQQRRVYRKEQLITEMQQNARFAMETISRDIRMAGYGLDVPEHQLNTWVSWLPNFHQNPMISSGSGSDSDVLTIVAAFDEPVAALSSGAPSGSQTLSVSMLRGNFGDTFKPSDLIFIGKSETLRIEDVNSGQLVVSSHPTSSRGIRHTYAAGTPVELVGTVEYEIVPGGAWGGDFPYLARIDSLTQYYWFRGGNHSYGRDGRQDLMVTAGYIEEMQFQRQSGGIEVSLRARTSQPDAYYVHPTFKDPYRRMNLTSLVRPRN